MTTVYLSGNRWIDTKMTAREVIGVLTDRTQGRFVPLVDDSGETVFVNRDQVPMVVER